jgi:uncharacterized protein YneF (UPF0154 family)
MDISVLMVILGVLLLFAVPAGVFFAIKYLIRYNAKTKTNVK